MQINDPVIEIALLNLRVTQLEHLLHREHDRVVEAEKVRDFLNARLVNYALDNFTREERVELETWRAHGGEFTEDLIQTIADREMDIRIFEYRRKKLEENSSEYIGELERKNRFLEEQLRKIKQH